jgi:hypothetical protein
MVGFKTSHRTTRLSSLLVALSMTPGLIGGAMAQSLSFEERLEEAPRMYSEKSFNYVDIPAYQTDDYRVVQVEFKGRPANQVLRPERAFFYVDDGDRALRYHYIGEEDGFFSYLVAVPAEHYGEVLIHGAYGARPTDMPNRSESRDAIVMEKRVVGAPDVMLLVDESGSMGSNVTGGLDRRDIAEQVVNNIAPNLEGQGSRVGIIGYDSSTQTRLALDDKHSNESFSASGGTGTDQAVERARQLLSGREASYQLIIDVTDGVANSPSDTEQQINLAEQQGIAVAAIGIGKEVPDYYQYSDYVTDSAANYELQDALADLVTTTRQRARQVDKPCEEGGVCYAEPLDTEGPDVVLETLSESSGVMESPEDLSLFAEDTYSGVDPDRVTATLRVGNQSFAAPLIQPEGIDYMMEVNGSQGPKQVDYALDTVSAQGDQDERYIEALIDAYLNDRPVEVTARVVDMEGNTSTVTEEFDFQPPSVTLDRVQIPAVEHPFTGPDGGPTIRILSNEGMREEAGPQVSVPYFASLQAGLTESMTLNGSTELAENGIVPAGELREEQNLRFDLQPSAAGNADTGEIVMMPANAYGKIIHLPIDLWVSDIGMTVNPEDVVQGLSKAAIDPVSNDVCSIVREERIAASRTPTEQPACIVEWLDFPDELYEARGQDTGGLRGFVSESGENQGEYRVLMGDSGNGLVEIAREEWALDVTDVADALVLEPNRKPESVHRLITNLEFEIVQTAGPECEIVKDEQQALNMAAGNTATCWVEWTSFPEGMEEVVYKDAPYIEGVIEDQEAQSAELAWSTRVMLPSGRMIDLGESSYEFDLLDPPEPSIGFESENIIDAEAERYWVNQNGGTIGDIRIEAAPAALELDIYRNDTLVDEVEYRAPSSSSILRQRRLNSVERALWSQDTYRIEARYALLPRVSATRTINVAAVPTDALRLGVEASATEILNTEEESATLSLTNPFADEAGYNAQTMGRWDARLAEQRSRTELVPMSEYKRLDSNGQATYAFEIGDVGSRVIRVSAEAAVESPIEGYEKVIEASRPVFVTVLRGGAIEADLQARTLEGPAPLSVIVSADLRNQLDYEALDEIIWEYRSVGGQWQVHESDSSFQSRFTGTFEKGQHEVRARLTNRNSDAEFVTQTLEIHAFDVPDFRIDGPRNVFIGDRGEFTLIDEADGEPIEADNFVIEWTEDGGESWQSGSESLGITRSEQGNVRVGARIRGANAPEGNEEAWVEEIIRTSFQPVRAPRARMYGPRLVEVGEQEEFAGRVREPYRDMDIDIEQRVILPDGTTVEGGQVMYAPTDQDMDAGMVEVVYQAWVPGYRDEGAFTEDAHRVRIWDYEWPEWAFSRRQTASEAPAEIDIRLRGLGASIRDVEGLSVEWDIPAGLEVLEARQEETRALMARTSGSYEVIAEVSDERGNHAIVREDITIDEPEPWAIGMEMMPSNEYMRAPLEMRTRPSIGGGHPRDRVEDYRYYVNGELVSEGRRYSALSLNSGTHTIRMEFDTAFGDTESYTEEVTVAPNQPPTCTIDGRARRSGWRFSAECVDPDGRVLDHIWSVDGEQLAQSGSRISIRARDGQSQPVVELIGVDDSGGQSRPVTAPFLGTGDTDEDRSSGDRDQTSERADPPESPEQDADEGSQSDADTASPKEVALEGWPQIALEFDKGAAYAPTAIEATLRAERGSLRRIEGIETEWQIPESLEILRDRRDERIVFALDRPGTARIAVTVSDEYGNERTVSGDVSVDPTPAWQVEMQIMRFSEYDRAPLEIRTRPDIEGGHPDDRVVGYRYLLNGEVVDEGSRYGRFTLPAGDHEITFQARTELGETIEHIERMQVAANQPPSCRIDTRDMRSGERLTANCTDPDGDVVAHRWIVDGEEQRRNSPRINLRYDEQSGRPSVQLIGIDDAGAESKPASL